MDSSGNSAGGNKNRRIIAVAIVVVIVIILGIGISEMIGISSTSVSTSATITPISTLSNTVSSTTSAATNTTTSPSGTSSTESSTTTASSASLTVTTPSQFAGATSTYTVNSTLGLQFSLSINSTSIESGQAINVSYSITNTLKTINNVSGEWDWALPSLSNFTYATAPCPRWDTFRVFSGYYTAGNISGATPVFLWPIFEGFLSCPNWNYSNYLFQPSSSVVNVSITFPPSYGNSFNTAENYSLAGYYLANGSSVRSTQFPAPNSFSPGNYTIVAGDEWGQAVMLHFHVNPGPGSTSGNPCSDIGNVTSTIATGGNSIGGPIAYDAHNGEIYATSQSFIMGDAGTANATYAINPVTNSSITIPVGADPTDIAFDPDNNNLYVTNFGSNSVSIINDSTNTVVENISVGAGPIRITYDPFNKYLYVSNRFSGTVSVIDPTSEKVVANITVGGSPFEIVYDSISHDLYVTDGSSGNVTIIDGSSNKIVGSFSLGQGSGIIAFDSQSNSLYFFPQDSQVLYVINGSDNQVIGNVSGIYDLNALAYDPANGGIYAAGNASAGFLYVVFGNETVSTLYGFNWVPVDLIPVNGSMYAGTNFANEIYVLTSEGANNATCTISNAKTTTNFGAGTTVIISTVTTG